jgi:hypothetical protein
MCWLPFMMNTPVGSPRSEVVKHCGSRSRLNGQRFGPDRFCPDLYFEDEAWLFRCLDAGCRSLQVAASLVQLVPSTDLQHRCSASCIRVLFLKAGLHTLEVYSNTGL